MKQIIIFGSALLIISCGTKYEMTNMLPETIDVTSYIESGEYRPDSCGKELSRLIKTTPPQLDSTYKQQLQELLSKWKSNYNSWLTKNNRDSIHLNISNLVRKTKYQYTYFPMYDPVDVFRTAMETEINGTEEFKLFVGVSEDGIICTGFEENGWVINDCDSVEFQSIY